MTKHTAAIVIAAVMAAGVMVTATTAAMAEKLIQYTERQEE